MNFKFRKHPVNCYIPNHHTSLVAAPLYDVFTSSGAVHLGFVAKSKNNQKRWVAAPKSVTHNVVLKRGFKDKHEAANYLYDVALINAI